MIRTTLNIEDFALSLPITQTAYQQAQQFAREQPTAAKAEQVKQNTLSVLVVNDYLQMMGINTDLSASDLWNPIVRLCADVSDLQIPEIGSLECRVVHSLTDCCYIPPETWEERIAYVVVMLDESQREGKILGFVPTVETEELPLNQLQPLEDFIDYLAELRPTSMASLVNLSQWFSDVLTTGWQTLETLWNQPELSPAYAFRSVAQNLASEESQGTVKRAKLIDLGIQIDNQLLMLIVELTPQTDGQTSIRIQLHPTSSQVYLTPGTKLTILDESGVVFLDAQARNNDNYVQLQLRGEPGEQFSVRVAYSDTSVTENFVI
ncbi:DUF1822 family protein [Calothrix sp. 336/3]|uniref:DUF1822 family protein n=1 Tax=Calothrix sp. 336/3 TaxID=1337936 RepID=UPI0004E29313|nr:DUF1822 family protein [Calothrix sp. 336/3]AKG20279.1 hypothetical protein IJ00_02190 [Calothrix sp. 336/3]